MFRHSILKLNKIIKSASYSTVPKYRKVPKSVNDLYRKDIIFTQREKDLLKLDIHSVLKLLNNNRTTSYELVNLCLKQIEKTENLNAYITLIPKERLLEKAREIDKKRAQGEYVGSLSGIPIAVKDNFNVKGTYTTCASKILENYISPYDSTVTSRLEKEGAIIIGKTNMDEFAMGSTNMNGAFGPSINPWSIPYGDFLSTGGSSGGSAAALASFTCYASTGSDTGGSVRLPACWNGLVGLKPSYGLSSRFGLVQYASSLDVPALFSRSVADAELLLNIISGEDENDSTSVTPPKINVKKEKFRVGIPKEYFVKELSPDIINLWNETINILKNNGCEIFEISLPHTRYALPAYYIIAPAEASSNLARYDGVRYGFRGQGKSVKDLYTNTRTEGFGDEVQRRIIIGTFVLSRSSYDNYYKKALQIRRLVRDDFEKVFNGDDSVDVILTPTSPTAAPNMKQILNQKPVDEYINDVFTIPGNLAGIPAMSVPVKINKEGLPLGMQLMGPQFHDQTMLNVAKIIEQNMWNYESQKNKISEHIL